MTFAVYGLQQHWPFCKLILPKYTGSEEDLTQKSIDSFGSYQVDAGEITLGDVFTVFGMMLFAVLGISQALSQLPEVRMPLCSCYMPSLDPPSINSQVFKTKAAFAMIADIVERMPEIPPQGGRTLEHFNGQVELVKVSFKYPTREDIVLRDLSLSVHTGQTVALVRALMP